MNSREKNITPSHCLVKLTGFLYLASFVVPIFNYYFIMADQFCSAQSMASTAQSMLSNEPLFRIAVLFEVLAAALNLGLGVLLYALLKKINRTIATLGLTFKLIEVVIAVVIGLGHFAALSILKTTDGATNEIAFAVGAFVNSYLELTAFAGLFMGLSMLMFTGLLLQSNLVWRPLVKLGVLSYALVFVYDLLSISNPDFAQITIIQVVGTAPVCLFTLIVSICLMSIRLSKKTGSHER